MRPAAVSWPLISSVLALLSLGAGPVRAQLAPGEPLAQLQFANWVSNLGGATDIVFLPDGRAVVTRKSGDVAVVGKDGMVLQAMAYKFTVDTGSEKGLLGVVADAQDNLYFYASTGMDAADKHRVYRGRLGADNTVTVELDKPIVTGGLEGPANHDGGGLIVHEGQLYVGVGDTGANATPPQNKYGACLNKANGKILRVNLDGSIPADNPLFAVPMATSCSQRTGGTFELAPPDKRIYAWGFRNPWRLWIDPQTDLMWIGDVGETTEEEITVGGKGSNHGWPFNEGKVKYPAPLGGLSDCAMMTPPTTCQPPEDSYPHNGSAASVTGGLIPSAGCGWGAFEQRYIFGDYNKGIVWTLDVKPDHSGAVPGSRKDFARVSSPVSFRMGPDGGVYVVSAGEGSVKRIAPKTIPASCSGAAPSPDGGAAGAGGAPGTGGAGGAAGAGGGDSSGCSCRLGAAPATAAPWLLLIAAVVGLGRRGRR
jgi:glucose/arabinose dehydrogenase